MLRVGYSRSVLQIGIAFAGYSLIIIVWLALRRQVLDLVLDLLEFLFVTL